MSSQVRLTLQPPPNVDFVQGYPGIPPAAPDRPQASVVGAVEVRVPQQGIKAEWIRVELRKVEILPGGGPNNTFHDYVGPSPVTLWDAEKDVQSGGVLTSRDFSFQIRIPESIPPSIALEERAGIRYELVASVCTKGKKGFFRKRKPVVVSSQAPIIIDKHDLHSTWPVYCQPEVRVATQDGVKLTVERNQTCFGPGDRIALIATLKSDTLHTIILRGFELSLKETMVYRAGPQTTKRAAPAPKMTVISESKLPVNATIYGGTQHSAELACVLAPSHTTTTLNAARHIDITYTLLVKALMGTGVTVSMELPVIISNWPRNVSIEAVRRIGPAQQLSLLPPNVNQSVIPSRTSNASPPTPSTLPARQTQNASPGGFNTVPAPSPGGFGNTTPTATGRVDDFGRPTGQVVGVGAASAGTAGAPGRRPASSSGAGGPGGTNRFTIVNGVPSEISEESSVARGPSLVAGGANASAGPAATPVTSGPAQRWLSAEEEKQRLYEEAKAKAELTQRNATNVTTPPPAAGTQPGPAARPNNILGGGGGSSAPRGSGQGKWLSAEEEKMRLYNEAQATAQKTQELAATGGYFSPATANANAGGASYNTAGPAGPAAARYATPSTPTAAPTSAGAALYQQAMSARNANQQQKVAQQLQQRQTTPPVSANTHSIHKVPSVPQYPSAEQEKAALRRYEEAVQAVNRTQTSAFGSSAVGINPAGASSSSSAYPSYSPAPQQQQQQPQRQATYQAPPVQAAPPPSNDMPPPFDGNTLSQVISEKERLRRAYEAQDAAALAAQRQQQQQQQQQLNSPPPPPFSSSSAGPSGSGSAGPSMNANINGYGAPQPTPPPVITGPSSILSAVNEKELLRRKYEAQDAVVAAPPPGPAPAYATPPPSPPQSAPAPYPGAPNAANIQSMMGTPGMSSPPQPPPRTNPNRARPAPPTPGTSSSPTRVLSAVEEKAMLRARYEADDNGPTAGNARSPSYTASPAIQYQTSSPTTPAYSQNQSYTSPPPLAPRPPAEYIQETHQEDIRIARYDSVPDGLRVNGTGNGSSSGMPGMGLRPPELNMQPFTPFTPGFEAVKTPGPPPPLPPKPAGE
ncbi:hypothetical protein AX16_007036 [Volvariella volvacea WC 439]|nr:hypothetical protein AX16_007036 [Volvariella volvacea WC 439]